LACRTLSLFRGNLYKFRKVVLAGKNKLLE